jgi:hypothetical protein
MRKAGRSYYLYQRKNDYHPKIHAQNHAVQSIDSQLAPALAYMKRQFEESAGN